MFNYIDPITNKDFINYKEKALIIYNNGLPKITIKPLSKGMN